MRNIRKLGMLAVATMALTAVFGTASASAVPTFTASSPGLKIVETTLQQYVFTVTGSSISCTNTSVEATTEGTDISSQSGHGNLSGCTAFGFAATVDNENCKGVGYANGNAAFVPTDTKNKCVTRLTVKNAFAECEIVRHEGEIVNAGFISNKEGHIVVKANEEANIPLEVTKSSGFCPLTVGKHTNAHLTGESTVQAEGGTISFDP